MTEDRKLRQKSEVPLDMWEVLAEEFEVAGHELSPEFERAAAVYYASPRAQEDQDKVDAVLFQEFHRVPRTALCISGGGVRSATFGLGVLHGLAKAREKFKQGNEQKSPLTEFDYLSTVSGGGYVGSWFSAWAAREEKDGKSGPEVVVDALAHTPLTKLDPEPEPLLHLRKYCRFLNPKMGALSADTWTLVATVGRNMVLNWLVLIPLIMAALVLPLLYQIAVTSGAIQVTPALMSLALWLGAAAGAWAAAYVGFHIPTLNRAKEGDKYPPKGTELSFVLLALIPFSLSALFLTLHWAWYVQKSQVNYTMLQFCVFGAGVYGAGSLAGSIGLLARGRVGPGLACLGVACAAVSGVGAGWAGYEISDLLMNTHWSAPKLYSCLAAPLVLLMFNVAAILAVGFTSEISDDDDREWWARSAAWVLIVMAVWLMFSVAVIFAPEWLEQGVNRIMAAAATAGMGGIAGWLGKSAKTVSGFHGDSTGGKPKSSVMDGASKLIGPVFLLMLVAVLALANDELLELLSTTPWPPGPLSQAAMLAVALLVVALISSLFININRFSLHAMYRARLVRTYLGASRPDRRRTANQFTDLDEADNIALTELVKKPLHLVNMALNLVSGKNLAWQQRKAESFTASRLRTGSPRIGYQNSDIYARNGHPPKGLSLGSAMAISGAAASPNMGYHSSPLLSLIMTLFNARLGWWLANPGEHGDGKWGKDGPTMSFVPILNEAFGRTTDESRWVYLSDGGHFENLGVYEMILRRCKTIVVVDGSQDEPYTFEDLGNAVRKARVDMGIPIEFEGIPIYGPRDTRNRYCAIGTIDYKCVDPGAEPGRILYIKACMKGTEPTDVLHYASLDPKFPQQGTDELWFDESQFESYRRLGAYIVEQIVGLPAVSTKPVVEQFVDAAEKFIGTKPGPRFAGWPQPGQLGGSLSGLIGTEPVEVRVDVAGVHH